MDRTNGKEADITLIECYLTNSIGDRITETNGVLDRNDIFPRGSDSTDPSGLTMATIAGFPSNPR